MKYAIFSDVDGTLSTDGKFVAEDIRKDVKKAQDKGIDFIIATGNPYFKAMKEMGESFNSRYIITSNGAGIIDLKKDEYVFKSKMSKEDCQAMLKKAYELKLGSDWWDENKLYFNSHVLPEVVDFWFKRDGFDVIITEAVEEDPFKIEFYDQESSHEKINEMIEFAKRFDVQIAHMKPHHVEITAPNVSKGDAITWLSEKLGVPLANTMGIGDSANDARMFETVNHSYAMANAPENIKKLTKHQTDLVTNNGVGKAINDFIKKNNL